jgi:hypothetical protein
MHDDGRITKEPYSGKFSQRCGVLLLAFLPNATAKYPRRLQFSNPENLI